MKTRCPAALLALVSLLARPAAAASHDPERATPTATTTGHPAASQLVHYLAATLQLSATQTQAVQQALKARPLRARTPEQLTERLRAVLTPTEFGRFTDLTSDVRSYEYLHYLAMR